MPGGEETGTGVSTEAKTVASEDGSTVMSPKSVESTTAGEGLSVEEREAAQQREMEKYGTAAVA